MIRTGDVIENPVTGEQLRFLATSHDTDGEAVVVECTVEPGGFVAAAHVHPYQEERFEVVSGTVGFKVAGETIVAGPGETLVVPAGTSHKFWNQGLCATSRSSARPSSTPSPSSSPSSPARRRS